MHGIVYDQERLTMNRIRSNELLNIRVRPGRERLITFDKLGIVPQKRKPIAPKLFVGFPV